MNEMELAAQRELDEEILTFVRGLETYGPVTEESVARYIRIQRARRVCARTIQDRLLYLAKAKYLEQITTWSGGSVTRYEITALGMQLLDGAIPPEGWKGQKSE
jgi:hypothetical protein